MDPEKLVFLTAADSGWANASGGGGKSQAGYIVMATTPEVSSKETRVSPLCWESFKHKRAKIQRTKDYRDNLYTNESD